MPQSSNRDIDTLSDTKMTNGTTDTHNPTPTSTNAHADAHADADIDVDGEADAEETSPSYEPGDEEDILLGGVPKITVMAGATTHAMSFQIEKEDHTLGNSLRYFINKNPDVEFCGYTIPHPSETRMCVRVQTWADSNTTAFEALRKGLQDMIEACEVVEGKFVQARDEFEGTRT